MKLLKWLFSINEPASNNSTTVNTIVMEDIVEDIVVEENVEHIDNKTKRVTISLTYTQHQKARYLSKEILGKENISGLVKILIERCEKEQKRKKRMDSWFWDENNL